MSNLDILRYSNVVTSDMELSEDEHALIDSYNTLELAQLVQWSDGLRHSDESDDGADGDRDSE